MSSVRQVVAGVLERDGKVLIAQRKRTRQQPLKWEFPGGKVEPGEDPRAALARKLREELGIEARIGENLDAYDVQYSGGPLTHLIFYRVAEFTGEPRNLDFEQIAWEPRERLGGYDFLTGDARFIQRLTGQMDAHSGH